IHRPGRTVGGKLSTCMVYPFDFWFAQEFRGRFRPRDFATITFGVVIDVEVLQLRSDHASRISSRQRGYSLRRVGSNSKVGGSDQMQSACPVFSSSMSSQVIPQLNCKTWRGLLV